MWEKTKKNFKNNEEKQIFVLEIWQKWQQDNCVLPLGRNIN